MACVAWCGIGCQELSACVCSKVCQLSVLCVLWGIKFVLCVNYLCDMFIGVLSVCVCSEEFQVSV